MKATRITPKAGEVYQNKGGGSYRCPGGYNGCAVMVNVQSGWTLKAHGVQQYEDGTIEWEYSTGGHWGAVPQQHTA